jgi:ESCRT-II complex subunit VPS22
MRRRKAGMGGRRQVGADGDKIEQAAQLLQNTKMGHIEQQLTGFKAHLEDFARKHKKAINKDPVFRRQFQTMCSAVGVDPLQSNKGFWAEVLGVGDFYIELGVQIIDVCLVTREQNGGMLEMKDLKVNIFYN